MGFVVKKSTTVVNQEFLEYKAPLEKRKIVTNEEIDKGKQQEQNLAANSRENTESSILVPNSPVLLNEQEKKSSRFYLPILYINDQTMWPSVPLSERKEFTDEVAYNVCLGNCCGVKDLKGACCQIDPDNIEHVLGPLDEPWIKKIIKVLRRNGQTVSRHDIVIDFEEGKIIGDKFFNGHPVFKTEQSYPMLRFQIYGQRFVCKFYNPLTAKCTIYEHRSDMCRNYLCSYIKANFLIKTKEHPNRFVKVI